MNYPSITIYTRPGCRSCHRVATLIDEAGPSYEVVNIDHDSNAEARTYVTEVLGAKSVPVIVSDTHEPIIGYQPDKIKELILALAEERKLNGSISGVR